MKNTRLLLIALFFAFLFAASSAFAGDICSKLTEDEVSAAVGMPLKRSPTDPCRFGHAMKSFSIIVHPGSAHDFDGYIANAKKEFPNTEAVNGIGARAIFFGFNLAVAYKNDVFVVNMFLGSSSAEKIKLSKAVAEKVIAHM